MILMVVVPFAELALLLWLAEQTSWWFTLAVVVATGIVGAALAKHQGWRTIRRVQSELAEGRVPTDALWDAAMILVAGALLLTPGIITDAFGFTLLLPVCRRTYRRWLSGWVRQHVRVETRTSRSTPTAPAGGRIIDSYVVREHDES